LTQQRLQLDMPSLSEPKQQINISLPLPNKNWQPDLFSTDLGHTRLAVSDFTQRHIIPFQSPRSIKALQ
jgi:hypothetical protein